MPNVDSHAFKYEPPEEVASHLQVIDGEDFCCQEGFYLLRPFKSPHSRLHLFVAAEPYASNPFTRRVDQTNVVGTGGD